MRRDRSLAWPAPLLMVIPLLLTECSTRSEIPPWFDALDRMPVRTVLVNGHRIAYVDVGDGPPVILIHGFGGSLWQWEYQQRPLSIDHRVITLDMPGSGFSDKPDISYTPAHLVESLRGFMDALNVPRTSLIGNSMGAGVVIGMALTYPERVDRLVLISGLPDHVEQKLTSPLIKRALNRWVPIWLVSLASYFTGRSTTRVVLNEIIHDRALITPAVLDRSHRNRKRPGMLRPLLTMTDNLPMWEAGFAQRFGEIRHATLVLWGAEDRIFPSQAGLELHRRIAGSEFQLIAETGHMPMWERPDLVNPLLRKFLQPGHEHPVLGKSMIR